MFLAAASCLLLGFILNVSGVQVKQISKCALKGSSVNLTCSAQHPTSDLGWYIIYLNFSKTEVSADGNHPKYSISEENNFTLTINNLVDTDANLYCCGKPTDKSVSCQKNLIIALSVTELQVKVIPSTEGQTVTLMCSTSCPLTGNPAAYMWYKNGEFLYEDWSPWYQEMLSSDPRVRYSCAVKGYEDLRAPQVSVDSVSATCFSVTYATGRMCSLKTEPCSITYPRGIHVQITPADEKHFRLTCNTSCPLTSFMWYKDRKKFRQKEKQQILVTSSTTDKSSFSCAVTGFEDFQSADICADDDCWSLNCVKRRICALEGSSVNISHEFSHPEDEQPKSTFWYKVKGNAIQKELQGNDVKYKEKKKEKILRLNNLEKSDSAEYKFIIKTHNNEEKQCRVPEVSLVVTGVTVIITPADVTEGQRVTLTCSTSCPLTDNTNYIWYLNGQFKNQSKHLVLDPVGLQHAGNYSCAVKEHRNMESAAKTLTVQSITRNWGAVSAGVGAAVVVLIVLIVILWIGFYRKKRTSSQSPYQETLDNMELYSGISAAAVEEEHYYSRVRLSKKPTDDLYSTVQPHQPQNPELNPYDVVQLSSSKLSNQADDS